MRDNKDPNNNPPTGEVIPPCKEDDKVPPSKEDILHKLRALQESGHFSRLFQDSAWFPSQVLSPVKQVNLDSLSGLHIQDANSACNRIAPVFLVPDTWAHWLTLAILLEELLCYTHKRWFRPYQSNIDRGQFLTRVCSVPDSPAPPSESCSQEMVDYTTMWSANLCARVEYTQSRKKGSDEKAAGERLYHMRPLFRAVALAIRFSAFNVTVTDISTIPVLIVRTGVEDGLSAPVHLEQVPEKDRLDTVYDSRGRLSAVQVTLDVAITFLMALEKREEADGPVTMDVVNSTRIMNPFVDLAAAHAEDMGWNSEQMGPLKGPSSTWVDAAKLSTWSGRGYETVRRHQDMCVRGRKAAESIKHAIQDEVSWLEYVRETGGRPTEEGCS